MFCLPLPLEKVSQVLKMPQKTRTDSILGQYPRNLPGTPGKPDPAVLIRAMEALNVSADECVLIGDTTFDMQLSQAVGVTAIGVNWGVHSQKNLEEFGVIVVEDFDSLQRLLI